MPYQTVRARGITFVFKYDPQFPEYLHIFVRHATTADEAIDTFFDPNRTSVWNERYERWETHSATHTLYWMWLEEGSRVMVITCFRR